jgi:hypothetical protein
LLKHFDLDKTRKKIRINEGIQEITERKGICQAFEVAGTFGVDGWSFFPIYNTESDFDLLLFILKGKAEPFSSFSYFPPPLYPSLARVLVLLKTSVISKQGKIYKGNTRENTPKSFKKSFRWKKKKKKKRERKDGGLEKKATTPRETNLLITTTICQVSEKKRERERSHPHTPANCIHT